ncbi:hypothetical protein HCH_03186 [Hahella chejuensis KCTC 2396]|uniref:Lipocalin-like domain-containing protein n=1 Tax=Hahella chejuensis (strain KCTC 2396) TaxID=349521 RepID=Q2SHC5_HAHCH|nr:hypothetical protein [Hahella chejuensis]ABC29949.1 hypothetical protein HCH_03186 [Hahella chejuensis KCTC 2396]
MSIESFVGTWLLVSSISVSSEIAQEPGAVRHDKIKSGLRGAGQELIEKAKPTSGLALTIDDNGEFKEEKEGEPQVKWFDTDGVLTPKVVPFSGVVRANKSGVFLQADDIPSWAAPTDRYSVILRFDDGDTTISDQIYLIDDKLVRTVNVVTDEAYLDRTVIVYSRL